MLDVSRIEEGKFGYEFRMGDIDKFAKKIFDELQPDAQRKHINFNFIEPAEPLSQISFDSDKLDIAIRNVIDNAIKYTMSGGNIEVKFRAEKKSLFLIIKDDGIGIPKEEQRFIFIKFYRAKNAIRFQTEGSGLGLYIAKNIAEKHNASLVFESEKDKGSTFIFQFSSEPQRMPKGTIQGVQ